MSETRYQSIDIDFEVYQLIVLEKRGFDEPENEVLRRLLGLADSTVAQPPSPPNEKSGSWLGHGVELPEGTKLKMTYSSAEHRGTVVGGKWKVGDAYYNTPSQAASGVARTRRGGKTMLNGWKYWYVKRPADPSWALLDTLRKDRQQ